MQPGELGFVQMSAHCTKDPTHVVVRPDHILVPAVL